MTGTIGDVEKPDPDRSRLELSVEITDLIHESEPGLIGKDRVALDFWEGPGYNVGGLVCTLDDWRYALPTGSPVVAVIHQPREGVLRPHNVGLFFEGKNGKGIRSAMLPDYEQTGEWKRIASLDALADRLRAAVEKK